MLNRSPTWSVGKEPQPRTAAGFAMRAEKARGPYGEVGATLCVQAQRLVKEHGAVILRHPAAVILSYWNRELGRNNDQEIMRKRVRSVTHDRTLGQSILIDGGWRVFRYVDITSDLDHFYQLAEHLEVTDVVVTPKDMAAKVDSSPKILQTVNDLPLDLQDMIRNCQWLAEKHNIPNL